MLGTGCEDEQLFWGHSPSMLQDRFQGRCSCQSHDVVTAFETTEPHTWSSVKKASLALGQEGLTGLAILPLGAVPTWRP